MRLGPAAKRFIRRWRNLLSRLEETLSDQKWIFLHLPKCGGTSIASGLQRALGAGPEAFIDPVQTRQWSQFDLSESERAEGSKRLFEVRVTLLRAHVHRGDPFIYGHFPIDECLLNDRRSEYRWLTVLRDPVDRVLSQFKYGILTREPSAARSLSSVTDRWETYLGSDLCHFHSNLYAYYLGGHPCRFDRSKIPEMRDRAKENLRKFDVSGCVENLRAVASDFHHLSGRDVDFQQLNTSKANSETREQMKVLEEFEETVDVDRLQKLTKGDAEIYGIVS